MAVNNTLQQSVTLKRDSSLDIISGILILYMMFYHIQAWSGYSNNIFKFLDRVFDFFMPWFFFKAGIFFHPKPFNIVIRDSYNRLIKPWLIWGIIGFIVYIFSHTSNGFISLCKIFCLDLILRGHMPGNGPLWFLFSFFFVRVICNSLLSKKQQTLFLREIIICVIIGYMASVKIKNPIYLGNIATGCFFFIMGYNMRKEQYSKMIKYISVFVSLFFVFFYPCQVKMLYTKVVCGSYFGWLFYSIASIVAWNNIIKEIAKKTNIGLCVLENIGKNSIIYLVSHRVLINIFLALFTIHEKKLLFCVMIIICMTFLPLLQILNRKYQWC